jgi:hypothetical protein
MITKKQEIEGILKQNGIAARVKITSNRIDVKKESDFKKAVVLFPSMTIVYGFGF